MASAHQGVVRKEEAAINELIEKAKVARPQDEMIFGGWLYNKRSSPQPLHLYAEYVWSGNFYNKYPEEFKESASFVQTAKKEDGIKTAVVYSVKTGEDPFHQYGYLLAWSDSFNGGKNIRKVLYDADAKNSLVYGYYGLLEKFNNIDWKKVEKDLYEASSSVSYIDAYTRTSVRAEIVANVVYAEFL